MQLVIDADHRDGVATLRLTGALDLASRPQLVDAGTAALAEEATTRLTIDLAGVDFIDSTGIGALVELAGDAEDSKRAFALRTPSQRVLRVLTTAGLLDAWPIEFTD